MIESAQKKMCGRIVAQPVGEAHQLKAVIGNNGCGRPEQEPEFVAECVLDPILEHADVGIGEFDGDDGVTGGRRKPRRPEIGERACIIRVKIVSVSPIKTNTKTKIRLG